MNLTRFSRLLLSVCVFLSVLCINLHSVHASEISDNSDFTFTLNGENDYYIDASSYIMPLSDDDYIGYANIINRQSLVYTNGSSSGANLWDGNYFGVSPNNTYKFVYKATFSKSYEGGSYNVSFIVPSSSEVNIAGSSFQFTDLEGNGLFSLLSADNYTYTPSDGNNAGYYTFMFNDISNDSDIGGFRLEINFSVESQISLAMYPMQIEVNHKDETKGLLNSIIKGIDSIVAYIVRLPSLIANNLKSLFQSIVTAVSDLGNFIIDGIKGLFVPSEEDLTAYFDNWKALLSSRFGALYEVFDIIVGYFEQFTNVSGNSTIVFPSVSIPLAGAVFEFGGWSVNLVPQGFEVVFSALRLMISIICTIAFVNALRRRYDKVVER